MTTARRVGLALGILLVAAAVLIDLLRGQPMSFGALQAMLAVSGLLLATVSVLGSRLPDAWRGLALVLLNTIVLIGLLELAAGFVLRRLPMPLYAGSIQLAWYDSQSWIKDYRAEFPRVNDLYRFAPFLQWEGAPFAGRTINVDSSGVRATPGPNIASAFTVFTFGGSTMWGVGSPDSLTIAAFLQAELAARSTQPVRVVNYGERAYVSTQELLRLERELRRGNVPDVVVFYDGLNDVNVAMQFGRADGFQNVNRVEQRLFQQSPRAAWLETWRIVRLARTLREREAGLDSVPGFRLRGVRPDSLAAMVAALYHGNHRIARELGHGYGFEVLSFLQPMIAIGNKPLARQELESLAAIAPGKREFLTMAFEAIRRTSDNAMIDLSGVFDAERNPVYIDWYHVGPPGNAIIARRIADAVAGLPSFPVRGVAPGKANDAR